MWCILFGWFAKRNSLSVAKRKGNLWRNNCDKINVSKTIAGCFLRLAIHKSVHKIKRWYKNTHIRLVVCAVWQASELNKKNADKKSDIVYEWFSRRSKWWQNQRFQLNCVSGRLFVRISVNTQSPILSLSCAYIFFCSYVIRFIWMLSTHNPLALAEAFMPSYICWHAWLYNTHNIEIFLSI